MGVPTRAPPNLCRNVHLSNHTLLPGEGGWGWNFPLHPQMPALSLKFHLGMFLGSFKVVENTRMWGRCSGKAPEIQEGKPEICSSTGRRKRTKFQFPGRKIIQKITQLTWKGLPAPLVALEGDLLWSPPGKYQGFVKGSLAQGPQSSITPKPALFPLHPSWLESKTQNTRFSQALRVYGVRKSLVSFQQHNKGILWINTGKLPALLNHLLIGSAAGRAIQGTEGMGGLQNKHGSNSRCLEDEITLAADGKREREVGSKAMGWEIQ